MTAIVPGVALPVLVRGRTYPRMPRSSPCLLVHVSSLSPYVPSEPLSTPSSLLVLLSLLPLFLALLLIVVEVIEVVLRVLLGLPPPAPGAAVGVYFKEEKDKTKRVLMKCLVMGDLLAIDVLDLEALDKEPYNIQINVKDCFSEAQPKNYGDMYKNFKGLVEILNSSILHKLDGKNTGVTKKPNVESSSSIHSSDNPRMGTTEPAYSTSVDPRSLPSGLVYPPVLPIDYNDAFPSPGAGLYPDRGLGRGGDMLVGPNDPRFFPSGQYPTPFGGPGGVPPGGRYDPIGPPDVPGFEPSRFMRRARHPGGSTHPDLEFFQQGPDF